VLAIAAALSSVLTANYNASAIDEVQTCLREAVHNCSCQQIAQCSMQSALLLLLLLLLVLTT